MPSYTPIIFSAIVIALFALIYLLFLRFLNRPWWWNRKIRLASIWLAPVGLIWVGVWWLAVTVGADWLRNMSVLLVGMVMVFEIALVLTLPLSSIIRNLGGWLAGLFGRSQREASKAGIPDEPPVDLGRRRAVGALAAAVPITTLAMGAGGFGRALAGINVFERGMTLPGLPNDLKGLKIFHMSDLHLGPFVKLDDIETALESAEKYHPDLILVTGDIADDLSVLGDVLSLIDQLKPRLGTYASLGNHEHFRGIEQITRIFDHSPVRLLVDEGITLTEGNGSIALTAIDDPRSMGRDHTQFFIDSLDKALQNSRTGDTVILMSHRPHVFDLASERGVNLTLAGHTHGGQLGLLGRSVFERYGDGHYLWGDYSQGNARLYTSAGMGHWFPFRLGCPPEAPVITLS